MASSVSTGGDSILTISIVIVNWNTRDLLRACLRSLPWGSPALHLQTIVVDNGSNDDSAAMVETEFPQVRLVRNADNVGFVRANNQGLAAATGHLLFMLNSDTEVREGAIERLAAVVGRDPHIGAVGPRLHNSDGTTQVSTGPFPQALFRFLPSRFEQAYERRVQSQVQSSPDHLANVDWLAGAALLFRREVYERVGGLDERYYMWYDDLDWAQKLRRAGYRSVYVGDAVIVHHGRQSGARLENRRLAEQLFDSEYTYLRLHHGRLTVCLVFALRLVKALVRRCLPLGQPARQEAAWRLAYHRSHFRRFCVERLP